MSKMIKFINLHRHDEFSLFDGFGKAKRAVEYANRLGQPALGLTNHGNIIGLIQHYKACKEVGIKPILGSEVYYQPKFDTEKESYHLCLFVKNVQGYQNLMAIITDANTNTFYKKPIVTHENLMKHKEGLICSTACIGGIPGKLILADKVKVAAKWLLQMEGLFEDDFYIEIMPYSVFDKDVDIQETVNNKLLKLSKKLDIKCIVTTDSHYIAPEDWETYKIMYKIAGKDIYSGYESRYMPDGKEIVKRLQNMANDGFSEHYLLGLLKNNEDLARKCDVELSFPIKVPKFDHDVESKRLLVDLCTKGYKEKLGKEKIASYIARMKKEYKTIVDLGFEDYFLLCWDIINFAKENDIPIGPGRGSVCGSLIAYLIGITQVDPILLKTDFERFLRPDKKKLPEKCWAV